MVNIGYSLSSNENYEDFKVDKYLEYEFNRHFQIPIEERWKI